MLQHTKLHKHVFVKKKITQNSMNKHRRFLANRMRSHDRESRVSNSRMDEEKKVVIATLYVCDRQAT